MKAYSKGKMFLVGKNIYYKNVIFFVQPIQNLVIIKGVTLVKANIFTLLK